MSAFPVDMDVDEVEPTAVPLPLTLRRSDSTPVEEHVYTCMNCGAQAKPGNSRLCQQGENERSIHVY